MIKNYLHTEHTDISCLEISESICANQISTLRENLAKTYESKRPFAVVILTDALTIDGAIIGELLEWRGKFSRNFQGDIVIAGISPTVEKLVREMQADTILKIYPDMHSAVNHLYWEYKGLTENILLSIPSTLSVVPSVRQLVKNSALTKGYSQREAFQLETIVDELCNNAVEHGSHGVAGTIEVALAIGRTKIEINIANGIEFINGDKSSPEAITKVMQSYRDKPNTAIDNPRGRGLALVKMLASEFEMDSSEDGTCVHVTKYREA